MSLSAQTITYQKLTLTRNSEQPIVSVCGQPAIRIVSKPMVKLEGVTGDFPGAAMQWERKRNEKMAQERKSAAE